MELNKKQSDAPLNSLPLRIEGFSGKHSFPRPSMILPNRKLHETCDAMIIARTIVGHESTDDLIVFLQKHRSVLGRVGVLTWADFWDDPKAAPHVDLRQMAQDEHILFISPGVVVDVANVLIWDALPLINIMDLVPTLTQHVAAKKAYVCMEDTLNPSMRAQIENTIKDAFQLPSIWLNEGAEFIELTAKATK
jgi:hypothetical protein